MISRFEGKTILITGGAGFIGSHLARTLISEGAEVIIVDDLSTGLIENIQSLPDPSKVRFHHSKVSQLKEFHSLVEASDYLIHLAAAVGVELVVKSPIRTIHTNLHETEVVLEAAEKVNCPILLASTSEVYGKSQASEFSEEDDLIIGPPQLGRWSYACSKLMDEFLCMAYAKEKKLPIRIVRFFNTVGPGQTGQHGMVLPRFIKSAMTGEAIRVFGDGSQTRCFCHVHDSVEALCRLMDIPKSQNEVVNIGSTEEITILDLAQLVKSELKSASKIEFIQYEEAYSSGFQDMQRRKPKIDKLKEITGFTPKHNIISIIKDTAKFLSDHPHHN